jgi:hypothetical protein
VLHHLADADARELLTVARELLRPGGIFRGVEPCFLAHQARVSRWIMGLDRGIAIRTDEQWQVLLAQVQQDSRSRIVTGLIRIPYVHILLEWTA